MRAREKYTKEFDVYTFYSTNDGGAMYTRREKRLLTSILGGCSIHGELHGGIFILVHTIANVVECSFYLFFAFFAFFLVSLSLFFGNKH